jgi:hypothetical protein
MNDVFIDFGCGPNMSQCIKYKSKNFYVIAVNKTQEDFFRNMKKKVDLEYYKLICDELNTFDLSDLSNKCTYKADRWHCGAVLEHVEEDKIKNFLINIGNNIKEKSIGTLNIDLTDHFGGFNHYRDLSKYSFIKNTLREEEWYDIIENHFHIDLYEKQYLAENNEYPSKLFFKLKKK